ncbi:MAG: ABC transporter permease [Pleurocapsa minor GSE-CHR-MK-17-07R]|jgi:ribose transport system permease protein|nr:ABC transporter permease [Pleurocapsa minor GSE-CHR-MK 17-07R]
MTTISAPKTRSPIGRTFSRNPFLLSLILLIIMIVINRALQDNMLEIGPLNGTLRTMMPAIFLAIGQTFVVIAGGVDLSVGSILSMTNAILAVMITQEATADQALVAILVALAAGLGAGALNGFGVTVLRLQPIVTTYATSFIFAGIALRILPEPGGRLPRDLTSFYRNPLQLSESFAIPLSLILITLLVIFWLVLSRTRFKQFLFATGGNADAAYTTGVRVSRVKFTTYLLSALFATLGALALTLGTGTGNPRAGELMTLPSVVAVVLGGTRLAGGQGNIIGSIIGVLILGLIGNIISFGDLDSWVRPLVDALIIIAALAIPGVIGLVRRLNQ